MLAASLLALSVAATGFLAWLWHAGHLGKGQAGQLLGAVLVGSMLVVVAKLALQFSRRAAIEEASAYRLLRDQPGRIVWVFPTVLRANLFGSEVAAEHIVILCTDDAKIERIRGVRSRDVDEVVATIRQRVPKAYFGLTEANRARYKALTGFDVK